MSTLLSAPLAGCVRLASVHDSVAEQDVVSWAGKQRCCRNGVGCPWRWWGCHQWKSLSRRTSASTCSISCLTCLGLQRPFTEYLQVWNNSSAAGNSSNGTWSSTPVPLEVVQDVVWPQKINACLLLFVHAIQTRSPVKGCRRREARHSCSHLLKAPLVSLRQLLPFIAPFLLTTLLILPSKTVSLLIIVSLFSDKTKLVFFKIHGVCRTQSWAMSWDCTSLLQLPKVSIAFSPVMNDDTHLTSTKICLLQHQVLMGSLLQWLQHVNMGATTSLSCTCFCRFN